MNGKVIIIDDEELARQLLADYVHQIPHLQLLGSYKNPVDALAICLSGKVDLILLDIQMPHLNGLDFLKTLDPKPLVILTTAYQQYALEGFELDVVDYLLKPITFERFLKAINKFSQRLQFIEPKTSAEVFTPKPSAHEETADYFTLKSGHDLFRVSTQDIFFIESLKDYVRYATLNKRYTTMGTLAALEETLPDYFLRVHKSYIVNSHKVESLKGGNLVLPPYEIPLGRKYKKVVIGKLFK